MSETVVILENPNISVRLRVSPRAQRFTLRLEPSGEGAVLTLPHGVPMSEARMFLIRQSDWLARALARQPGRIVVGDGVRLPVAGNDVEIRMIDGPRRAPHLEDGQLILSAPASRGALAGPRVAAFLKSRARDVLVPAAQSYSGLLGRRAVAVTLRDTRSRWGSCTNQGRLSFSWRLAMAPPEVLDYVAAHEAAHLLEMNHGPGFWAVVERIMPDYRRHRAWLKSEGRKLHSFQFGAE
ncbi:MAG TPA: SprT family zinc-dependent metalloprotease [Thermohalobaculum sp.]|nr:SprT family zinc-dependent metalloprotease [Thermohalobaculum sp.]